MGQHPQVIKRVGAQTPFNFYAASDAWSGDDEVCHQTHIFSTESGIDGKALAPEADEVGVNSGKVLVAGSDGAPTSPPMAGNGSNFQAGLAPAAAAAADLGVVGGVSRNPSKL